MTTDPDDPRDDGRSLLWEAAGNALRPYAGWLFYAFGALLVLLGWLGISGESVVAKQLPYLISGGIGGVLLAILGASFLGIEELRRDSGRLDRMERQIEELHRALLARPDAPPLDSPEPATTSPRAEANGRGPTAEEHTSRFVLVEAGESFHREACALVAGKEATEVDLASASDRGLRPCPVCEPVVSVP